MKRSAEFIVRSIRKHDIPVLTPFLKKHFYFEEAIFKNLYSNYHSKLSKEEMSTIDEDMLNETKYIMALNSPGIIIVHKESKEMAAAATMFTYENRKIKDQHYSVYQNFPAKSMFFRNYLDITGAMIKKANIFEHFPQAKKAIEFDTAAVNEKFRGQGLYLKLLEESIKYTQDNQFDLIYGLFTSDSSKRAPEKLSFKSIADLNLDDYTSDTPISMKTRSGCVASVMAKLI